MVKSSILLFLLIPIFLFGQKYDEMLDGVYHYHELGRGKKVNDQRVFWDIYKQTNGRKGLLQNDDTLCAPFFDLIKRICIYSEDTATIKLYSFGIFTSDGKKGICDSAGHIIIPSEYDEIETHEELTKIIYLRNGKGFYVFNPVINKIIGPFKCVYLNKSYTLCNEENGYSLWNDSLNQILAPQEFRITKILGNKKRYFIYETNNDCLGIIDYKGVPIIKAKYRNGYQIIELKRRDIFIITDKNYKKTIVDNRNRRLLPKQYDDLFVLENKFTFFIWAQTPKKTFVFNFNGEKIVSHDYCFHGLRSHLSDEGAVYTGDERPQSYTGFISNDTLILNMGYDEKPIFLTSDGKILNRYRYKEIYAFPSPSLTYLLKNFDSTCVITDNHLNEINRINLRKQKIISGYSYQLIIDSIGNLFTPEGKLIDANVKWYGEAISDIPIIVYIKDGKAFAYVKGAIIVYSKKEFPNHTFPKLLDSMSFEGLSKEYEIDEDGTAQILK